jgi:hypothetical protein
MSKDSLSVEERLNAHPQLKEHVLGLLEIAESEIVSADEAEERTIEGVRGLGKQVLQEWANHQEQVQAQRLQGDTSARGHGKKTPLAQHIRRD